MMVNSVLKQFLAEEAVTYVRNLIFDAVDKHENNPDEFHKLFELNRFDVTLNYAKSTVSIEDVLDSEASGEVTLSLKEFLFILAEDAGRMEKGARS
jgi:hypothetical protein